MLYIVFKGHVVKMSRLTSEGQTVS